MWEGEYLQWTWKLHQNQTGRKYEKSCNVAMNSRDENKVKQV